MFRRLIGILALAGLAATAHAAFTVDQLMAELAQHPGGRVKFVERRYLAVLDRPLIAAGEMTYAPPDRLEKRTLTPTPEILRLDHDRLVVEHGRRRLSFDLAGRPEALAFVDSVRSTLAGDRTALEKSYRLDLSGSPDQWVLTLTPTEPRIAALLRLITVGGSEDRIRTIDYLLTDGDRTEITLLPIESK